MTIFLTIAAVVLTTYLFVILFASLKIMTSVKTDRSNGTSTNFTYSIIVPFRNEKENLAGIFKDLKMLDFEQNRFEVIFINDNSTDDSSGRLNNFEFPENFRLIKASKQGKKNAIVQAVSSATGIYIYTVDADCRLPSGILKCIDNTLQLNKPKLLVQPVIAENGDNLLSRFQYYDYLSLMGINKVAYGLSGKPALASGANLVFNKDAFNHLNPFENNVHISSGDDMFLLRSFVEYDPASVILNYTPQSLVVTKPENSWAKLVKQRIRWAGKMKRFSDTTSFLLGLLSVFVQVVFIVFFALGLCYQKQYLFYFVGLWLIKSIIDYLFFRKIALLLGQKAHWMRVFLLEIVYMIFVPLVVLLSLFIHPKWKGRKITD